MRLPREVRGVLGSGSLGGVRKRIRAGLWSDPENVNRVGLGLAPDDPPSRLVRHPNEDYPCVGTVAQATAADLARILAQPLQDFLDALSAVGAECPVGFESAGDRRTRVVPVEAEPHRGLLGHDASRSISSPSNAPDARYAATWGFFCHMAASVA